MRGSCFSNSFFFFFCAAGRIFSVRLKVKLEWKLRMHVNRCASIDLSCNCYKIIKEMPVQSTVNLFIPSSIKLNFS